MENQNTPIQPNINQEQLPKQPIQPSPVKLPNRVSKFRRIFYQVLIACLVLSSAVGVIVVLTGNFNVTLARAIATIAMVAIHATLSFGYITASEKRNNKSVSQTDDIFSNIIFTLLVISFITSVFAIWKFIGGEITYKLYAMYGVFLFATLHAEVLYRIRKLEKKIDTLISANYFSILIVVVMLTIVIFASNTWIVNNFYYRVLSAVAIIDAAMTISAVIMRKLFMQKHPDLAIKFDNSEQGKILKRSLFRRPLFVIVFLYLAAQIIIPLVYVIYFAIRK